VISATKSICRGSKLVLLYCFFFSNIDQLFRPYGVSASVPALVSDAVRLVVSVFVYGAVSAPYLFLRAFLLFLSTVSVTDDCGLPPPDANRNSLTTSDSCTLYAASFFYEFFDDFFPPLVLCCLFLSSQNELVAGNECKRGTECRRGFSSGSNGSSSEVLLSLSLSLSHSYTHVLSVDNTGFNQPSSIALIVLFSHFLCLCGSVLFSALSPLCLHY
jgi:hypothetical protein